MHKGLKSSAIRSNHWQRHFVPGTPYAISHAAAVRCSLLDPTLAILAVSDLCTSRSMTMMMFTHVAIADRYHFCLGVLRDIALPRTRQAAVHAKASPQKDALEVAHPVLQCCSSPMLMVSLLLRVLLILGVGASPH